VLVFVFSSVGVACVTAGPGLTNTITAVKNAQMAVRSFLFCVIDFFRICSHYLTVIDHYEIFIIITINILNFVIITMKYCHLSSTTSCLYKKNC
jgi:hypothetical protein